MTPNKTKLTVRKSARTDGSGWTRGQAARA